MRAVTVFALLVSLAAVAAMAVAFGRYPGSAAVFLLFNACFIALAAAALPRPRAYVYTILSVLLLLGLWAKTLVHTIWSLQFVEPVGAFGNSPAEWDWALLAMSAGARGELAARGLHILYRRKWPARPAAVTVPVWFPNYRTALWVAALVAVIAVNAANLRFGFFQIGINAKLLLPLRFHIVVAWLINIGFALGIAALVWWDFLARPASLSRNIAVAFFEALISSISALSRIAYLVHATPYWLALWEERRRLASGTSGRRLAVLALAFVSFFAGSILAVFALRATLYPDNADLARNIKLEIPQLIVGRWVGLEGVLTVGAVPERDTALLFRVLADSPKAGADSLYQRIAHTRYRTDDTGRFTFLTSPGPIATLLFSGSLAIVALGMAACVLVLLATEEAALRWTANPFVLAVAGAGLANVFSQTTFAYLTLIFTLQMWVALVLIGAASRVGR